jgi:hypothetical protein
MKVPCAEFVATADLFDILVATGCRREIYHGHHARRGGTSC